jgi:hypothetical protein
MCYICGGECFLKKAALPRTPFQKLFWQGIGIVGVDVFGDPRINTCDDGTSTNITNGLFKAPPWGELAA